MHADCTEGDEDEHPEAMAAGLLMAHTQGEAQRERRRALQARAALHTRKGFTLATSRGHSGGSKTSPPEALNITGTRAVH